MLGCVGHVGHRDKYAYVHLDKIPYGSLGILMGKSMSAFVVMGKSIRAFVVMDYMTDVLDGLCFDFQVGYSFYVFVFLGVYDSIICFFRVLGSCQLFIFFLMSGVCVHIFSCENFLADLDVFWIVYSLVRVDGLG